MNFCLSDLVPPLRWSDASTITLLTGQPDLPDAWWRSLPMPRVLAAIGPESLGELLTEIALEHWPAAAIGDVLPALHVLDPDEADEPAVAIALDRAGSWAGLLALTSRELVDQPFIQARPVLNTLFSAVLVRLAHAHGGPVAEAVAAAPGRAAAAGEPAAAAVVAQGGAEAVAEHGMPAGGHLAKAAEAVPGSRTDDEPHEWVPEVPSPELVANFPAVAPVPGADSRVPAVPPQGDLLDGPSQGDLLDGPRPVPDQVPEAGAAEARAAEPVLDADAEPVVDEGRDPEPVLDAAEEPAPEPAVEEAAALRSEAPYAPAEEAQELAEAAHGPAEADAQAADAGAEVAHYAEAAPAEHAEHAEAAQYAGEPVGEPEGDEEPEAMPAEGDVLEQARAEPEPVEPEHAEQVHAEAEQAKAELAHAEAPHAAFAPAEAEPEQREQAEDEAAHAEAEPEEPEHGEPEPAYAEAAQAAGDGQVEGLPELIEAAFAGLDDKSWAVAQNRVFTDEPSAVDQLAKLFAVPPAEIAATEDELRARLDHWLASDEAAPYRAHLDELVATLGPTAPKEQLIGAADWHNVEIRALEVPAWQFVLATLAPPPPAEPVPQQVPQQMPKPEPLPKRQPQAQLHPPPLDMPHSAFGPVQFPPPGPPQFQAFTPVAPPATEQNGAPPEDGDEGYQPLKDVSQTRRCFRQPDGRWWLRIDVTAEQLAGGECALPTGFASYLGLSPGESRTVRSAAGELTMTWHGRPLLESIERLLIDVGAREGGHLFLTLSDEGVLRARHLPVAAQGAEKITKALRLVGYTAPGGTRDQAARVIATRIGLAGPVALPELLNRLRERGDRDLLELLD